MMKTTLTIAIIAGGIFLSMGHARIGSAAASEHHNVDVHMHLSGQCQGGTDWEASADLLVALMDRVSVAKSLIMPPPATPGQRGITRYQEFRTVLQKYPDRLVLAAGGGDLNPLIVGTDPGAVTDATRTQFEALAADIIAAGAKAFGEMMVLHYSFQESHPFEQVPADHPLFLLLADLAAQYNVPIDLHMEAVLEDQPTPQGLRRISPNNPATTLATIPGLERLLAHNRNARIVWQHIGWDNTGQMTLESVRRLLTTHPNLYAAVHEDPNVEKVSSFKTDNRIHDNAYHPKAEWIALMQEFPDRFMVGSDEFIKIPGQNCPGGPPGGFERTWGIINQLPSDVRDKVGYENAVRVYRLNE